MLGSCEQPCVRVCTTGSGRQSDITPLNGRFQEPDLDAEAGTDPASEPVRGILVPTSRLSVTREDLETLCVT